MADVYNLLFQQLIDLNVRELPGEGKHPLKLLLLLDEFARLGRASVIASGFSYVAGYGIRLLPVIQARGQLRDVTNEIVQNCGVELVFTPKDNAVAKEISERLGNYTYSAKSKSKKVWDAWEGSVSTSEQRRPLMLPQELLLMSQDDVVVLRDASGGESRASQRAVPMSDSQALSGIELESLAGFPTEGLPDDGDPAKAVEYFKVAGLTFDPTWLDRNREKFGSAADNAGIDPDQGPEGDAFEKISEKRKQA